MKIVGWARLAKPNVYCEKYDDFHVRNLFVFGKRWASFYSAQPTALQPGMTLLDTVDGLLTVVSQQAEDVRETVFNIQVAEFHTYHVGELGVWVHNANCCPKNDAASVAGANPYLDRSLDSFNKSKQSYEKLIKEHQEKLDEFKRDPMRFDDGRMANATPEVRQKMIEGRIGALEKQMKKQRIGLEKVNEAIQRVKGGTP